MQVFRACKEDEVLYVEADGVMRGGKEVKVGRMFTSGSCIAPNGKSSWIRHSQYIAHLGNSKAFTKQMEDSIESYGKLGNRLVFICDGGTSACRPDPPAGAWHPAG